MTPISTTAGGRSTRSSARSSETNAIASRRCFGRDGGIGQFGAATIHSGWETLVVRRLDESSTPFATCLRKRQVADLSPPELVWNGYEPIERRLQQYHAQRLRDDCGEQRFAVKNDGAFTQPFRGAPVRQSLDSHLTQQSASHALIGWSIRESRRLCRFDARRRRSPSQPAPTRRRNSSYVERRSRLHFETGGIPATPRGHEQGAA